MKQQSAAGEAEVHSNTMTKREPIKIEIKSHYLKIYLCIETHYTVC